MAENWILDAPKVVSKNLSVPHPSHPTILTGTDQLLTSTAPNLSEIKQQVTIYKTSSTDDTDEFSKENSNYKNNVVKAQVVDKEYKYIRNNYKNPSDPAVANPNYPDFPDSSTSSYSGKPNNLNPNYSKNSNSSKPQPVGKTDWFKPNPYPYQIIGAIQATQGKTLIADEPGLGKTIQAILWAAITKPNRLLIICPPNLATNWHQEITRTGITQNAIHGTLLQIKPTKKTFLFPKTGIIICPDTLLTARPGLQKQIKQWKPLAAIIDESHRYKNPYAKRTKTILRICHPTPNVLALTGTPIVSNPVDLFATLSVLGKLEHFPEDFVNTYTVKNYWGDRKPNPATLPDLYARLDRHVWIRRTKNQVLKDLPPKTRAHQTIDLTKAELDAVFAPLKQKITNWKTRPDDPEALAEHAKRYVSQARKATGLAKIPAATEWIINHHTGTGRPLIAWIIHKKVASLLAKNLEKAGIKTAIYNGNTPASDRNRIVEDFQAGKIDVLIGQITAAGVGLTLTRAQDALFVETEWTPALIVQAEDRIHRITQTAPVTITTLIATGTLDPVIHKILSQKIKTLDALTPGSDHQVTSSPATGASTTRFLAGLLANHLQKGTPLT